MPRGREILTIQTPDGPKDVTMLADGTLVLDIGKTAYAGGGMPGWEGFMGFYAIEGKGVDAPPAPTNTSTEQEHAAGTMTLRLAADTHS